MKHIVHDWMFKFACIKCGYVNPYKDAMPRDRNAPELCSGCGEVGTMERRVVRETYHNPFWFWQDGYSTYEIKDSIPDGDE